MTSPILSMHALFSHVHTNHIYLGASNEAPEQLIATPNKTLQLKRAYQIAQSQVLRLINIDPSPLTDKICHLQALEKEGDHSFLRYSLKTRTWSRRFLKGLEYYSPRFLKAILPRLFANGLTQNEKETELAYKEFKQSLRSTCNDLTRQIVQSPLLQRPPSPPSFPSPLSLFPLPFPSLLEDECTRSVEEQAALTAQARLSQRKKIAIDKNKAAATKIIARLNETNQIPLSLEKFTDFLKTLGNHLNRLYILLPDLDKEGILKECGLDHSLIPVFLNPSFTALLFAGRGNEIASQLNPTVWGQACEEALKRSYLQVSVRKTMNTAFLTFYKDGKPYRESEAKRYNGQMRFNCNDLQLVKDFLTAHSETCNPDSLDIHFSENDELSPQLFAELLELTNRVPDVTLKGISALDFCTMNLSAEEEKTIIENFSRLSFSGLRSITLANHDQSSIAPERFSSLLEACPHPDLMKACLLACSEPKKIDLPPLLLAQKHIDLSGYPFSLLEHLLNQFSEIEFLTLDQDEVTPAFLQSLHERGDLNSLQGLKISDCSNLTTDALFTLTRLPSLTILEAPHFSQGLRPLSELPKFSNPFKIQLFYTQSEQTRPYASSLYTGISLWATRFQIPLARAGVAEVFSPNHFVLDPYSVACWLHKSDYRHLQPQTAVQTIIADHSAQLTDDTIVEFIQKFPNTSELSLHNCPGITNRGLKALLEACPQLKKIDLTGCLGITNEWLLDNDSLLQQHAELKLDLSDTSVSPDVARLFNDLLNGRITFETRSLKIQNKDLTDDEALERILSSQPLNHLHRIDLEDCSNLTDAALSKLLDRLNTDQRQQDEEGIWQDNPQRLNIAILNLKGCTAITDKAFDGVEIEGKVTPKILNSLSQVAIGHTQLTKAPSLLLASLYPRIVFQEELIPITRALAIDEQLEACEQMPEQAPSSRLAYHDIQNRIAVELFVEEIDARRAFEVIRKPLDVQATLFKDFSLSFYRRENNRTLAIQTYQDLLYSQSGYFREKMRPGKEMWGASHVDLINQNATALAARAILDLMHGRAIYQQLDWKTAGQAAELSSKDNLQLPSIHYHTLLKHIHSQFNLTEADEMLVLASQLNDETGKALYEQALIHLAEAHFDMVHEELSLLSQNHGLWKLEDKLTEIAIQTQLAP